MDLIDLRWKLCGWTRKDAARKLGVTARTITNWETGKTRAPRYVADYYRLASGHAPSWSAWAGWRLLDDVLTDPTGARYTPEEIRNHRWIVEQLQYHQHHQERQRIGNVKGCAATRPDGHPD